MKIKHTINLYDTAAAYVLTADRLFGKDYSTFNNNRATFTIFVNLMFQSLEISIKHVGIESKLFSLKTAKNYGHDIAELTAISNQAIGGDDRSKPIYYAMTYFNEIENSKDIIFEMIYGEKFKKTRDSYKKRKLGYAQIQDGDFLYFNNLEVWIESLKETIVNLPKAIDLISQWQNSESKSKFFFIGNNQ